MLTVPTFQTWMRITDRELGCRVAGSIKASYPDVPNSCTVAKKKIPMSNFSPGDRETDWIGPLPNNRTIRGGPLSAQKRRVIRPFSRT